MTHVIFETSISYVILSFMLMSCQPSVISRLLNPKLAQFVLHIEIRISQDHLQLHLSCT